MTEESFKNRVTQLISKKYLKNKKLKKLVIAVDSRLYNNIKQRLKHVFLKTRGNKITLHCIYRYIKQ